MEFFNMDNPFFRLMGRLTDLVWLNILTLICCIPVVTAGAAISAMYHVLFHMILNEEGYVTEPFFRAFRENLKQTVIVWAASVAALLILIMNAYLIVQGVMDGLGSLKIAAGISIGLVAALLLMFLQYFLALTARYDSDLKQTMNNALLLVFGYLPQSICIVVIGVFPIALMVLSDFFLYVWFIYGISFPGYVSAMLISGVFVKTQYKNGKPEEEAPLDLEELLEE